MTIVDAHLHLWNPDSPQRPWRDGWREHALGPAFDIDDALLAMDGAGVDRALVIPAAWDRQGNELVEAAVRRHPDRFLGVGVLPARTQRTASELTAWSQSTGFVALRQLFPPGAPVSRLEDGSVDWLWAAAESAGLPVLVWAPGQLPALGTVIDRHPGLRLVVDHLNLPMAACLDDIAQQITALCELASRPSIAVKASALPCLAGDGYPYASLHPFVRQVVDEFGAERVFWGTDLARLPCSYREAVTMFQCDLPLLSPAERGLVLGDSLLAWLGRA